MSRPFLIGTMLTALAWATPAPAAEPAYPPHVSIENGVKVMAILEDSPSAEIWRIAVVMETHTHALDEAMEKVSVLLAGGKRYSPLAWAGTSPGGHHRRGTLRFKAISPLPDAVELRITLSGERAPRSFKWRLK